MIAHDSSAHLEDLGSVGTRIRWGAIFAGGMVALGLYFLLGILGAAVGLSISDKLSPTALTSGAVLWALLTTCVALFLGGMVTSLFTVGENKTESLLYGVIMWAVLFSAFVGLGAAGVRTGITSMAGMSDPSRATTEGWVTSAREAGVPPQQIEEWRVKLAGNPESAAQAAQARKTSTEAATRITWYAFLGMWLSMLAAAGGAVVGAGPTFRLINVTASGGMGGSQSSPNDQLSPNTGNEHRGVLSRPS